MLIEKNVLYYLLKLYVLIKLKFVVPINILDSEQNKRASG